MTIADGNLAINSEPVFLAELKPYRSLGTVGFRLLFALTGVFTLFNVIFFLVANALPVAMFFGLDFALLYGAFWLNNRAARAREEVCMSRTELTIRKVSATGRVREARFNPFWARFDVARHDEVGITDMAVVERNRRTTLGGFLGYDERESFAAAFTEALASIKRRI